MHFLLVADKNEEISWRVAKHFEIVLVSSQSYDADHVHIGDTSAQA